jgi:ABC-type transport system involved in cytochrome c biogenesis permease component
MNWLDWALLVGTLALCVFVGVSGAIPSETIRNRIMLAVLGLLVTLAVIGWGVEG